MHSGYSGAAHQKAIDWFNGRKASDTGSSHDVGHVKQMLGMKSEVDSTSFDSKKAAITDDKEEYFELLHFLLQKSVSLNAVPEFFDMMQACTPSP